MPSSIQRYARLTAILMLLSIVGGGFGEAYVPSAVVVPGDAAATARHLAASASLMQLGFLGYIVEALCDVGITWALFVILRPIQRELALLGVFLRLIGTASFLMCEIVFFMAARIVGGADYLNTFSSGQLATLALLAVKVSTFGQTVSGLFYGAGSAVFGYLIARSTFLPRWLGVLLLISGLAFVIHTILSVLGIGAGSILVAPMVIAWLLLTGWLLAKGVDADKWREARRFD